MVKWSDPARDDLKAIFEYIALDSRFYAQKVVRDIVERTEMLDDMAERGRIVPEIREDSVPEIFVYSYPIMYQVSGKSVEILAVIHGRREVSREDIQRL